MAKKNTETENTPEMKEVSVEEMAGALTGEQPDKVRVVETKEEPVVVLEKVEVSQTVEQKIKQQMRGKVFLKAIVDRAWPPDKDSFMKGKNADEKFNRLPKCQDGLAVKKDRNGYITGLLPEEERVLEKMLYKAPGSLNNSPDNKYWRDFLIKLGEDKETFDLEQPMDYLMYRLLLVHRSVANSYVDYIDGKWPGATYVISNVREEAKVENIKTKQKMDAWKLYSSMSIEDMREIALINGKKPDSLSNEELENYIVNELIEKNPGTFTSQVTLANKKERVLLERLIHKNMVKMRGSTYYFGEHTLGIDKESAAAFLAKQENQTLRIQLEARVRQ